MNYFRLLWDLFQLRNNTKKDRKEIENLQKNKLRKILIYAYKNSNYYHELFEKIGLSEEKLSKCPMERIPVLERSTLISQFDRIITTNNVTQEELREFDKNEDIKNKTYKKKYHCIRSSGSTGKPAYFLYDESAWNKMIVGIVRAALWNMSMGEILKILINNKPRIVYIAATAGRYAGAMAVGDAIDKLGIKQITLDVNVPISKWINDIKKFKPNVIIGYPSAIKILGGLLEKGKISLKVYRIITCGEPLDINLRKYIEKVFDSKVINVYGASESLALGVEADSEEGMILFDDLNYIEVINGEMYVTALYNFVQPLIRYHITDKLVINKNVKRKPFSIADSIIGRDEDVLWFTNNNGVKEFLHPLVLEGFCVEGLIDYQFRQKGLNVIEMFVQVSSNEKKIYVYREVVKYIKEVLEEKGLGYAKLEVKFVRNIFPDPKTGKKKMIIKGYREC